MTCNFVRRAGTFRIMAKITSCTMPIKGWDCLASSEGTTDEVAAVAAVAATDVSAPAPDVATVAAAATVAPAPAPDVATVVAAFE